MPAPYSNNQKRFLEDRIWIYQNSNLWNHNNDACWDLLERDLMWGLDQSVVLRKNNASGESNASYAKRCVRNWRFWNVDLNLFQATAA